jgi:hypothetical protein
MMPAFDLSAGKGTWRISLCLVLLFSLALFTNIACSSRDDSPAELGAPLSSAAAEQPGLSYDIPDEWTQETPSSRLRQAQFRLPRAEGDPEDAELAVFYFGGQGGSIQGNIDRWVGQFSKPDGSTAQADAVSTKESNGITFAIVDVSGTYNQATGPMMGGGETIAKPNFRMLAAIAETPGGPWFFKLTGPEKTIEKWEEPLGAFLDSIRLSRQTL